MVKILFILLVVISSVEPIQASTMQTVLQKLASTTVKHAKFTETRFSSYLKQPLISKGELEFRAPATMIKKIQQPEKLTQRIEGNDLYILVNGKEKQAIYLPTHIELETGINAIRWVLSGNEKILSEEFSTKFISDDVSWQIELTPRNDELSSVISSIVFDGKDGVVTHITITQSNGDTVKTLLYEHQ